MAPHFHSHRCAGCSRPFGRRALALCLVAGLWPFPLPVVHQHGGAQSARVDPALARHLALRHGAAAGHGWFAWHVHWVLPGRFGTADDRDEDQQDPESPLALGGDTLIAVKVSRPLLAPAAFFEMPPSDQIAGGPLLCEVSPPRLEAGRPPNYLQSYSSAQPLRARIGVALC